MWWGIAGWEKSYPAFVSGGRMPKYNITDSNGEWLGTINAESEADAIERAKKQGMPSADKAEERDDISARTFSQLDLFKWARGVYHACLPNKAV